MRRPNFGSRKTHFGRMRGERKRGRGGNKTVGDPRGR